MAKKSRRKLETTDSGYSGRNYVWGSDTYRLLSITLTLVVMIGVVGGILLKDIVKIDLKYILMGALLILGVIEWVRAQDNKEKGGPKRFTKIFFFFGVAMMIFGIAAAIIF